MGYRKRIVCLAKSKKRGATCIAGLEWDGASAGDWIRPIGKRPSEAIEDGEMAYEGGGAVALLDVVEIEFLGPRPHGCQVENHLIDDQYWWERMGTLDVSQLRDLAEEPPDIWGVENLGYIRARLPVADADALDSSLMLVRLESAEVDVKDWGNRVAVRVGFNYKGVHYSLGATDRDFVKRFQSQGEGTYRLAPECYGCLSLSEPYDDGYRYKLAAAIFEVE